MWLLQLKMSRTEVGKEGKSNMFLPKHILESRMKSWSGKEGTEISKSVPHTGALFRGMLMVLTMCVVFMRTGRCIAVVFVSSQRLELRVQKATVAGEKKEFR